MTNRNPQAAQMADESMVRNLSAQARAIWPQEQALFERYRLAADARILDLACGTGEITARLAELLPGANLIGADIEAAHLNTAAQRCAEYGPRVQFTRADAYELPWQNEFDLVVCRHMFQAVPEAHTVLAQMHRAARPGGVLHVLAEDYNMMHFWPVAHDNDEFWRLGPISYARNTGTDLRSGRKVLTWMHELGMHAVRVDYVTLDTVRSDRESFAQIWQAWRDGYTDTIAEHTILTRQQVWDGWNEMIAAIRDPHGYGCWHIPVISGRK